MSIKAGLGLGVTNVSTTNTVLVNYTDLVVDRYTVSMMTAFNDSASPVLLSVYASPDLTTASGKRIDHVYIPAGLGAFVSHIIGSGFAENIIAITDTESVNVTTTLTTYTNGD